MNFLIRRFWRISLMASIFCLFQTGSANASDDSYLCIDANLSDQQLSVMSVCSTAPVISCPPIYYGCPGWQTDPIYTGFATAVAGDADCPSPVVSFTDEIVVNQSCHYEVHRTWTAEYPGNFNPWLYADCTQLLYLYDTSNPLIKNCPANITVPMNSDCVGIATWNEPVYTDNCGISTAGSNYPSGSTFQEGVTTVTYTVYDNCGNSNTCSFHVTVLGSCCAEPPTIACPSNLTICPGQGASSYHPSNTGYATVSPGANCNTNPILTWSDSEQTVTSCTNGKIIIRTWIATDPNDATLVSTCTQLISLLDTEKPTIVSCPSSITIHTEDLNGAIASWSDPVFYDNCGIASVNPSHISGTLFPAGCNTVTMSAIDYCGNFVNCSFQVCIILDVCETAPIITCPPNRSICPGGGPTAYHPDRMGYATAIPGGLFCNQPIVTWSDIFISNNSCPNGMQIKRTWTATDTENPTLTNSCIQIIDINDTTLPNIDICGSDISVQANDSNGVTVTYPTPAFSDNCGISNVVSSNNSGDVFPIGTTAVSYTAYNYCGNTVTCTFNITVAPPECMTAPIVSCPADLTLCVDADTHPNAIGYATATASGTNCDSPIITWSDYIQPTAKCAGALVITRTWTAKDPNNGALATSCDQSITTQDHVDPVLTACPTNISVIAQNNGCQAIVNWIAPYATDNCGIASVLSSHSSGSTFGAGTTTVTYTATDNCGNSSTCSFTINVTCANIGCSVAPNINCPADWYGCPGTSSHPSTTGFATSTPGLSSCDMPITSYLDQLVSNGPCAGAKVIHRTWTATDPNNSTVYSSCVQIITLSDNTAPIVNSCPSNINLTGDANCQAIATWAIPVATDNCGGANISSTHNPGSTFGNGTTTVTYTITDYCGNVSYCSFTVTVNCNVSCSAPIISCPSYFAACPGTSTDPTTTGYPTVSPGSTNCGTPIVTYFDQTQSTGPCAGATYIYRIWTATDPDDATNYSQCVQAINLADTVAPVIASGPTDIVVNGDANCQAIVNWSTPIYTDNCGTANVYSNYTSGSVFTTGTTTVSYTITDNCGNIAYHNFNVTVNCNITTCQSPPILNCPANWIACPGSASHPSTTGFASATAGSANCDTPIVTYSDQIISTGPCYGAKEIYRTWTATDPSNSTNSTSCVQTINLVDTTIPTIVTCPDNIAVLAGSSCTAAVNWVDPIATDNCGIASMTSNYYSGATFSTGTTTVTYTITDNCGNVSYCSFTVTITCSNQGCSVPPIINCPANYSACAGGGTHPSITGYATAIAGLASCDAPIITYSDAVISNGPCAGAQVLHRTWIATDPNNSSISTSCIQTISTGDSQAPSFVYCPSDITIDGGAWCDALAAWSAVTATDNCGTPTLTSSHIVGQLLPEGLTTVTYTASDACGNVAYCSFNVTVTCGNACDQPPVINCPPNVSLCPGSAYSPVQTGTATAYGAANCGVPIITYNDIVVSYGTCGDKVIHRVWTATEPMATYLTSSCTQVISLQDNYAPGIWDCPSDMTVSGGQAAYWIAPTADDNCNLISFVSSHNSGTVFPAGTTTVSYTATDACGNVSYCSFNVTSAGSNGNLNCPDNIVVGCGTNGGAYVNWAPPVFTGTCASGCNSGNYIPGFIYMGTFGGSQFYCSINPATWFQAEAACLANGGHLATISNSGENTFLANVLTNQTAWIGLNDYTNEGTFTWSNGEPVTYTNWYASQPNDYNYNQDFVGLMPDGTWNDEYNYESFEYIMEIACDPVIQTGGQAPGSFFTVGTHTIHYAVDAACGGATCSFTVTVEPSLSITCVDNINLSCPTGDSGMYVNWQQPVANSCCTDCSGGGYIPGFLYMGSFNGHYYYCSLSPKTWTGANASSQSHGGYLAAIGSASENNFLANILSIQSAWIGLNDANNPGNFSWSNGDPLTYANWYPQQPNNYGNNQNYVEMLNSGQWNDQYNDSVLEYIMEIPGCVNVTQTGGPYSGSYFNAGTTTTITYQASDECGNVEYCSFNVTITGSECNSGGINSTPLYIAGVTFGNLQNTSGNDGGYEDYTYKCANVQAGGSYPISLSPGFGGYNKKCYWKVWIDYNMDGDYTDDGEYIAYGVGSGVINGTISLPWINIWNGTTTMRVACKYGSYPTGPCEVFSVGETEDYCVNISGGEVQQDGFVETRSSDINNAISLSGDNKDSDYELNVYPNPAIDFINIEHSDADKVVKIEIYNATGKVVRTGIGAEEHRIELQGLENGMYILSTRYADGNVKTSRFIVQQR